MLLTIFTYAYYIGYKPAEIDAAFFHLTPNSFYFVCISVIWCILATTILINKRKILSYIKSGKNTVSYNISYSDRIAFAAILIVSLLTRIVGYNWGYGMTFHPDESEVTHYPEIMARDNSLLSGGVYYPAQISGKILTVLYEIYGLLCNLFDWNYSDLVLNHIARILIALFSVGTVICIYFIGNHLKRHAGTVAATLAALFPPFVQMAHCVTGDPIIAFFSCLMILSAFYYYADCHKIKWIVIMSILSAMAGMEKYNGAVLCGFIAIIVISDSVHKKSCNLKKIIREGIVAISTVIMTILLTVPNLVVHYNDVLDGIAYVTYGFSEDGNNTFFQNFYEYIMEFTSYSGIICLLLLAVGIIFMIMKPIKEYFVFSIGLVIMIAMCLQNRACLRWGYVFYICFIIIIGISVVTIYSYLHTKCNKIAINILYIAMGLVLINNASGTLLFDTVYANSKQDTRVLAGEWCEEREITPLDCIYDKYTCFNPGSISKNVVEWTPISERIEYNGNEYVLNTLGRKYAIANIERNGYENGLTNLPVLVSYQPLYPFDGFKVDFYTSYTNKIYELYSIKYNLNLITQIFNKEICFGYTTNIYDVSSLPAYQTFDYGDFSSVNDTDKMSAEILSISEGEYFVQTDDSINAQITLKDNVGNTIYEFDLNNGTGSFRLNQHYYNINMLIDDATIFSELTISTGL
jgi:hypothetical protein